MGIIYSNTINIFMLCTMITQVSNQEQNYCDRIVTEN